MGQLEAYGIHEIYLTGMMVGLFLNYVAEKHESDTFESMKSYFYSANFSKLLTKKAKFIKPAVSIVYTSENAAFALANMFNLNRG